MTGVSFLIDTDWVIDHLNSLSPATQRLRELEPQGIAINIITVAELWERGSADFVPFKVCSS